MSARAERLARVRAIVDRRCGETITVTPMLAAGQYGAVTPDPARTPFAVVGEIVLARGEPHSISGGPALVIPDGGAAAFVDYAAWPNVLHVVKGDQLVSDDRAGFLFEVAAPERAINGRKILMLKVLKSP